MFSYAKRRRRAPRLKRRIACSAITGAGVICHPHGTVTPPEDGCLGTYREPWTVK
jgi:hypothetical protein